MSNWATLYRQPTRLKVAAEPLLELFQCERFACKLTRTGCTNRFHLAQGSTRDGISERAVLYGACRRCPVGEAHARGDPTPKNQFPMEVVPMDLAETSETDTSTKKYAERICRRGLHPFIPTTATARACDDQACKSRAHATPAAGAKSNGKHKHNGKRKRTRGQRRPPLVNAPAKLGAVPKGVRAEGSPEDLLELEASPRQVLEAAGFTVCSYKTPSGHWMQVT